VDAVTDFFANLLASTGLTANTAVILCAAAALGIIILSVVVALSRRIDRLEGSLMDLRQLHTTMHETQTYHAQVVGVLGSIADALPDLEGFKQYLRNATDQQSELTGGLARVSIDLEGMRDHVAASLLDTKSELTTLRESIEDYYPRMETIQASLRVLEDEQRKVYKILKAWDSKLKDLERTTAAVPSIRTEQAAIKGELAEWNSRFDAASVVLAEFLQSEDPSNDRPSRSDPSTER
jgi:DNA repair exonuclease SbcCD ATPase subunit